MALLVIDTSASRCAALIRVGGGGDVLVSEEIGRGHDRRLAPIVAAALAEAKVEARSIRRIGVVTGPGSFTGLRVGAAFARGMAIALGAEAVGVSALDALGAQMSGRALSAAVHDVKRGEVVWRAYRRGASFGEAQPTRARAEDLRASLLDLAAEHGGSVALAGSAAELLAGGPLEDMGLRLPKMGVIADLAESLTAADHPALPAYHRGPDAKPMARAAESEPGNAG